MYGKKPDNFSVVNDVFQKILSKYPGNKVEKAFEMWLEKSEEFPTPSDIVNLILRNGKMPLSESQYISISRKEGQDRTDAEWQYLKDYEADRDRGWEEEPDTIKNYEIMEENIRLKKQLREVMEDRDRAWEHVNSLKRQKDIMPPPDSEQAKIERTIHVMRAGGSPEEDIEAFKKSMGVSA